MGASEPPQPPRPPLPAPPERPELVPGRNGGREIRAWLLVGGILRRMEVGDPDGLTEAEDAPRLLP
jgi:hypothetical protein